MSKRCDQSGIRPSGLSDTARKHFEIGVLSIPALVMFLGFVILPVIMAAYYGFFRWKGYGKPQVNGQFHHQADRHQRSLLRDRKSVV